MNAQTKFTRKIIEIDEEKCNGCGQCVPNCREGALRIIGGKARLVGERYCDGLGACLGHCPQDAIRIIERPAEAFDEEAVEQRRPHACPSARAFSVTRKPERPRPSQERSAPSELGNWPLQLALVPVNAPYFQDACVLIAADCAGFSCPDFHSRLLAGKILINTCPKLDDSAFSIQKLAQIFRENRLKSVTVVHMEVPCCFGLKMIVEEAMAEAGKEFPVNDVTVTIEGKIKEQ
ncbi:MAG: 4Fe-4S binding protein [Candidatus Omnitrophota bacterium]